MIIQKIYLRGPVIHCIVGVCYVHVKDVGGTIPPKYLEHFTNFDITLGIHFRHLSLDIPHQCSTLLTWYQISPLISSNFHPLPSITIYLIHLLCSNIVYHWFVGHCEGGEGCNTLGTGYVLRFYTSVCIIT